MDTFVVVLKNVEESELSGKESPAALGYREVCKKEMKVVTNGGVSQPEFGCLFS